MFKIRMPSASRISALTASLLRLSSPASQGSGRGVTHCDDGGAQAIDRDLLQAQTAHLYAAGGVGRKRDREAFEGIWVCGGGVCSINHDTVVSTRVGSVSTSVTLHTAPRTCGKRAAESIEMQSKRL